jgi:hypothetical protein
MVLLEMEVVAQEQLVVLVVPVDIVLAQEMEVQELLLQ